MLEILPILSIVCIIVLFITTVGIGAILYLAYMEREPFLGVVMGLIAIPIFILILAISIQVIKLDQSTKVTNESTIKYTN